MKDERYEDKVAVDWKNHEEKERERERIFDGDASFAHGHKRPQNARLKERHRGICMQMYPWLHPRRGWEIQDLNPFNEILVDQIVSGCRFAFESSEVARDY